MPSSYRSLGLARFLEVSDGIHLDQEEVKILRKAEEILAIIVTVGSKTPYRDL